MIVPRNGLLLAVGAGVLPLSAAAAVAPSFAVPALAGIAFLFLIAFADLALASRSLRDLSVEFPEVVRLARGKEGAISFVVRNERKAGRSLELGIALPDAVSSENDTLRLSLPGDQTMTRFDWPCSGIRRGVFRLERCHVEGTTPLRLWSVRKSLPIACELRVYPNLLSELRQVAALFLNRGPFGVHARRQIGQGRDFEKLREYLPGDGLDQIHWKATAKRGHLVTKLFQIERTQEVYVVIDSSRLSGRSIPENGGTDGGENVLERYITAGLVLGAAAQRQGDLFGLITFDNRVSRFIRAGSGRSHYNACRDALATLRAGEGSPDFRELCSFIGMRLRKRALLVMLTNLDDPAIAESFSRGITLTARKHLVIAGMLRPSGVAPLFGRGVEHFDELYAELGGHLLLQQLLEMGKGLEQRGVRFSLFEQGTLCPQLVTQYMEIKGRQLL